VSEQVEEYSNKVANVMLERGFKKGDVVGLLMENRPEFVGIWLGMSKVGIVTALINYNQRMVSLLHSIKVANCTCLIYGAELSSGKNIGLQLLRLHADVKTVLHSRIIVFLLINKKNNPWQEAYITRGFKINTARIKVAGGGGT